MKFERKINAQFKKLDNQLSLTIEEPIFKIIDERLFPHEGIMEFHSKQKSILWTDNEIDYSISDITDSFPKLEEEHQTIIKSILLFFTVADKLVISNLESLSKIPYKSAGYFFAIQNYIESIHDIIYEKAARLYYNDTDKYCTDMEILNHILHNAEKYSDEVFDLSNYSCPEYEKKNEIEKLIFEAVSLKVNLMNKWKNVNSFTHNLVAFFIIENISFNALFSLINTFKEYNKGLKYIIEINEFVSRDEKIHADFGLYIYKNFIVNKLPENEFKFILKEITDIEIAFLEKIIPKNRKINNRTVDDYVNFVKEYANGITTELDYNNIYNDVNETRPEFNIPQMKVKQNFFERTGTYVTNNKKVTHDHIIQLFEDEDVSDTDNNNI
ncbi:putative ribonucleoside diphosphate reductase small subunit [Yalta virus]|nr:putative ribonucleoside diphosphate reductase small subunit [Yalta virus]